MNYWWIDFGRLAFTSLGALLVGYNFGIDMGAASWLFVTSIAPSFGFGDEE